MPVGQPAHDGGLLLANRLGDWVDVHVEHRRLGLPFQLPGKIGVPQEYRGDGYI